jgi:hypothetical protein
MTPTDPEQEQEDTQEHPILPEEWPDPQPEPDEPPSHPPAEPEDDS